MKFDSWYYPEIDHYYYMTQFKSDLNMLPKKGRRKITVDDILYHYIISGCISVVIRNSETGELIKWGEDWKPKWENQLKPSDIEKIIREHEEK